MKRNYTMKSSYSEEDVKVLLKDISDYVQEEDNLTREKKIQNGVHYSEMLPIEYSTSETYLNLYKDQLKLNKSKLAYAVGIMAEKIYKNKGEKLVLVSLARAGTPIGVLAKRYIKMKYGINVSHYTISIIRGKGIDKNAIDYISELHGSHNIQFVDGWTGKGTIYNVLKEACEEYNKERQAKLDFSLAVLADPAGYSNLYGIREDFLIPSACLNSIVSGLISRTVLRDDLIGKDDFHGAKYYNHLENEDLSNSYVDTIEASFKDVKGDVDGTMKNWERDSLSKIGDVDVSNIKEKYGVSDINHIKPGIGETTRVLLRRVPDIILVNDKSNEELKHIILLAEEKNVEVKEECFKGYKCCGIIKRMKDL